MLKQKFEQEMIIALKAKEQIKLNIYRGLIAQIKNMEIDKKDSLSDSEIIALLKKQVKTLEEANVMFLKGGREDLVKVNNNEIAILKAYLPQEISDEELRQKVKLVVEKHQEIANIGQLIGITVRELKDVADPSRIFAVVKSLKT